MSKARRRVLREVGAAVGLTKERVRQLWHHAIEKLRKRLGVG